MEVRQIATVHNGFSAKFGLPRQSGLAESVESRIVFEEEYRIPEALRGIEQYSHLWLIWAFHQAPRAGWTPTVRPPRLGGNTRVGVFATRSPVRPNPIGLSCVRLVRVEHTADEGDVLIVSGTDNGAMIGAAAYYTMKARGAASLTLNAVPALRFV